MSVGFPGTDVMDGRELSCRELNPGPLQEQVFLTIELSLQPFLVFS